MTSSGTGVNHDIRSVADTIASENFVHNGPALKQVQNDVNSLWASADSVSQSTLTQDLQAAGYTASEAQMKATEVAGACGEHDVNQLDDLLGAMFAEQGGVSMSTASQYSTELCESLVGHPLNGTASVA